MDECRGVLSARGEGKSALKRKVVDGNVKREQSFNYSIYRFFIEKRKQLHPLSKGKGEGMGVSGGEVGEGRMGKKGWQS